MELEGDTWKWIVCAAISLALTFYIILWNQSNK